ncbi:hypothetical protein [Arenibacterium sp. LLYu02]|uniref:hypothetical protein n=1 Tax=Arenibacterium sp. LLYu02 TaxID=3404132 RepID=UPI003B224764
MKALEDLRKIASTFPRVVRTPVREISPARTLRGGRLRDAGRLPRYASLFAIALFLIWSPIISYLKTATPQFRSTMSLILPGSGASASVNLERIGQASSFANSAFSSNTISPTETYKRLLSAERILKAAAFAEDVSLKDFGKPRIELVDQTSLIHISLDASTPEAAQARLSALLTAFQHEIEALRSDEIAVREEGASSAIEEYHAAVMRTRMEITLLQQKTGLLSVEQYDALIAETDALALTERDLAAELEQASGRVRAMEASLGLDAARASATLRLHADSAFVALSDEMSARAAELAEAQGHYGDQHPNLRVAQAAYDSARAAARQRARVLTGLAHSVLDTMDLSLTGNRADLLGQLVSEAALRDGLAAQHTALAAQLTTAQAHRVDLLRPAARLEDLQRDFSVAEAVFASAMARVQSSKADLYASYPLIQVLEDPSLPFDAVSPRPKLALAGGVAATIFCLIGLFLGWVRRPLIDRLLTTERGERAPDSRTVAAE